MSKSMYEGRGFQWGKEQGGQQVVICLDCFDWATARPEVCNEWLHRHLDVCTMMVS